MLRRFLLGFMLVVVSSLFGQDDEISTLQGKLQNAKDDTTRVTILLNLAEIISEDSVWMAYNDSAGVITDLHLANPQETFLEFYTTAKAMVIGNRGYWYNSKGNYVAGLDLYHESLKLFEEVNDSLGIANSLNNIAYIHQNMGDFDLAEEYYSKSLEIKRARKDTDNTIITMGNLASVKTFMHDTVGAMKLYHEIIGIVNTDPWSWSRANSMSNLGMIYFDRHQYDSAYYYLNNAKTIRVHNNDRKGIFLSGLVLSHYWLAMKNTDSARYYLNSAHGIATDIQSNELLKRSTEGWYKFYKETGNYEMALKFYEQHNAYSDSIFNQETKTATLRKYLSYEYEKQKIADSLDAANKEKMNNLVIAEGEARLSQANTQRIALIVVLVLVAIVAFVVFNRYRDSQRKKKIIEDQKTEVEFQKNLVVQKNTEILDSINYARRLQNAILAPDTVVKMSLPESFILYLPKDIVAGDFYFFETTNDYVFIAAADCTGHGVPGAMMSVVCANALSRAVKEFRITKPGAILDKVNALVEETFSRSESSIYDGMDISLLRLPIKREEEITCEWAGANIPLVYVNDGFIHEVKGDKQPVGRFEGAKPFTTHSVIFRRGTFISLFTDGYADQFGGPKGKKFKYAQLKELLVEISTQDPQEQKKKLQDALELWRGDLEQVDDVCVVGIRL